jgi:hypothetical protein
MNLDHTKAPHKPRLAHQPAIRSPRLGAADLAGQAHPPWS